VAHPPEGRVKLRHAADCIKTGWHDATLEKYGTTDKSGNFDTSDTFLLNDDASMALN
jgi:hypothetical protein